MVFPELPCHSYLVIRPIVVAGAVGDERDFEVAKLSFMFDVFRGEIVFSSELFRFNEEVNS